MNDTPDGMIETADVAGARVKDMFRGRIGTWLTLIIMTGSAQAAVQAIGFVGGIVVIRLLPTHEYALYTLANTMLGTMTLLADGGISSGVMAQGGRVWQDRSRLGAILATGLWLRRRFAVISLIVALPILCYLLRKHDSSLLMTVMIILSLIPAFFTSLSGSLLEIVPKLHQAIPNLQKIQVFVNAWRLLLLGGTLFVYPYAAVAVACAGLAQVWYNWRLGKIVDRYADRSQPVDPMARKEILSMVKRILPGAIYYSISGQITIFLLSIFGSTEGVAQVGALGRLSMALNIFSVMSGVLLVPRFARLGKTQSILKSYMLIMFVMVFISIAVVGAVWLFPAQTVFVLGKDYASLDRNAVLELVGFEKIFATANIYLVVSPVLLMAAGSCAGLVGGIAFSLNSSRGYVVSPYFSIPYNIITQIIFLLMFDLSVITGVLAVNFLVNLFQIFMHVIFFGSVYHGHRHLHLV